MLITIRTAKARHRRLLMPIGSDISEFASRDSDAVAAPASGVPESMLDFGRNQWGHMNVDRKFAPWTYLCCQLFNVVRAFPLFNNIESSLLQLQCRTQPTSTSVNHDPFSFTEYYTLHPRQMAPATVLHITRLRGQEKNFNLLYAGT